MAGGFTGITGLIGVFGPGAAIPIALIIPSRIIAPFRFKNITIIPVTFVDIDTVGIQWELEETLEAPETFEFFVDRSGSPDGPWQEIATALKNNTFIDTTINRFSRNREIWYRIRVRNKITGKTTASTDKGAFPLLTNWEEDLPRGAISRFEELQAGAVSLHTTFDLRQLEIIRRYNLLLTRFSGTLVAIRKAKSFGTRCPDCFDETLRRTISSFCPSCFGVGFLGGYFDQINTFINFDPNPETVAILPRGETQDSNTVASMSNFPIMSPRDVIIEISGRRWLITRVDFTGLKLQHSRQVLQLREVNPNEKNIYNVPIDPIELADESEFIGFSPKGGSGLL